MLEAIFELRLKNMGNRLIGKLNSSPNKNVRLLALIGLKPFVSPAPWAVLLRTNEGVKVSRNERPERLNEDEELRF